MSVAPEILPELQIQVESLILKSSTLIISSTCPYLQIFDLVFRLILIYDISQGVLINKPDNSDGSRGQLTAGANTCHLLQIQSPWT
jgi:hypothetical protein